MRRFTTLLLFSFIFILASSSFAQFSKVKSEKGEAYSPQSTDRSTTLRYDNGVNFNSIGLTSGGTFEYAARFPATMVTPLAGQSITHVLTYIGDPGTFNLKIYGAGTTTTPGSLLYTQSFTAITDAWKTIDLTTPVVVGTTDIWVSIEVTHAAGVFPAGTDAGPAVVDGDWIYNGGVWSRLSVIAPTLNYNWNLAAVVEDLGPGCNVGDPINPSPANNATNVSASLASITWSNPPEANTNTLWFGTAPNSLNNVQSGTLATSWSVSGPLSYSTTYYWRVEEVGDTCSTLGPVWSFTVESDPNILTAFFDDFESNTDSTASGWVIVNDGGTLVWRVFPFPANPFFPNYPNTYTLPCGGTCGKVLSADSDEGGSSTGPTTLRSTATINQTFNATQHQTVMLEFDNDVNNLDVDDFEYVEVSNDGGSTWNIAWQFGGTTTDLRNTHEVVNLSTWAALHNFQVRFRSVQPGWDWWWTIDNVAIYLSNAVPVELTSFAASVVGGKVNLNWSTATETNNYGFDVERKITGQEFTKVGFVAGFGTTTEAKNYNFVDNSVTSGNYTYRLKQVDLDGTSEYSNEVEVSLAPSSYSLDQNYPNPFNPSTKINFSLASDSKVTLKIFDVLGQEVTTLINGSLSAGIHNLNFDASGINSGVYFYTIEATGVDGTNFKSTKKMMLTK